MSIETEQYSNFEWQQWISPEICYLLSLYFTNSHGIYVKFEASLKSFLWLLLILKDIKIIIAKQYIMKWRIMDWNYGGVSRVFKFRIIFYQDHLSY